MGPFFKEVLRSLEDPELDRLVGLGQLISPTDGGRTRPARINWEDLRDMAERRFDKRGVRVLAIDEANHLARHRHPADLVTTLDVVKAFTKAAKVRIVLCGAPGLREFERASAQLGRRIIPFEFHRYRWTVAREKNAFRKIARSMLECIEGLDTAVIEASLDQCFERSLGCVGTLYDWLVQAEHEFVTSGRPWSACLARPAPSTEKALVSLDEIEAFERRTQPATRAALRLRLGLTKAKGSAKAAEKDAAAKPASDPPRVGRRAPGRDAHGPAAA